MSTPSSAKNLYDVAIIGAGMSGLAAAIRLAIAGKRAVLLEKHSAPGGLNGYYSKNRLRFDAGLHAVTNFAAPGTKNAPLTKIFRQLRLQPDAFALAPQFGSAIHTAGKQLRFNNDFSLLESEVAREFPKFANAFRRLDADLRALDATALDAQPASARKFVKERITNPDLADALFLPNFYYGSARTNDMDLPQFAIIWRALFHEGFGRPLAGVRQIISALTAKLRELGGELRLNCSVKKIITTGISDGQPRVAALLLADGSEIYATKILSSAGLRETTALCGERGAESRERGDAAGITGRQFSCSDGVHAAPSPSTGEAATLPPHSPLSFAEAISVFDRQPRDLGWNDTIIFFNNAPRFDYAPTTSLTDTRSGVICLPNNYDYTAGATLPHGWLRVTALAGATAWRNLRARSEADYAAAKLTAHDALVATALAHLPAPSSPLPAPIATDFFTPLTVERFTGHFDGAIYGSPVKNRDGRTLLENLFLIGTDQGFLGITGALLSGISMANLHCLSD